MQTFYDNSGLGYLIKHLLIDIFRLLYSSGAMIDCSCLLELEVEPPVKNTSYSLPAMYGIYYKKGDPPFEQ